MDDAPDLAAPGPTDDTDTADDERAEQRRVLCCRTCGLELADLSDLFPGSRSLQVNPAGVLHEIVTVSEARNLVLAGRPTAQATWFAGYAWDVAWCVGCATHLGWQYIGDRSPPRFYGLRVAAIVQR